jgi:hypothetical protein
MSALCEKQTLALSANRGRHIRKTPIAGVRDEPTRGLRTLRKGSGYQWPPLSQFM